MSKVHVLLVTHGGAGTAMLVAARALLGETALADVAALDVPVGAAKADTSRRVREKIDELDDGGGVLVACDLHGSTPANCAVEIGKNGHVVAVVTGLNFPMLVKLASLAHDETTPDALAKAAAETAIRSIRLEGTHS